MRRATILMAALLAGACARTPPPTFTCQFSRFPLQVEDPAAAGAPSADAAAAAGLPPPPSGADAAPDTAPDTALADAGQPEQTLSTEIQRTIAQEQAERTATSERYSLLFMSGGSQNGAFGAGFLDAWRLDSTGDVLPTFRVVTGISTGAILGLFAFTGETGKAVSGYSITHERELLTPYVRMRAGKPTNRSYLDILRRGAMADLVPLRGRIAERLDDAMLDRLGQGYRDGRRYFVGVVNVDSGDAEALDMTEMAARVGPQGDPGARAGVKACLVEAIVASSSAPLAAPPVFIDNRMYVDGGARFGVFAAEIGAALALEAALAAEGRSPLPPRYYVLVNGDQQVGPVCAKADRSLCTPDNPVGPDEGPHARWNVLDLALRSEKILTNQVYRFSADRIATLARAHGSPFRFAKVDGDADAHYFELDDPVLGRGVRTCAAWRDVDALTLDPVQFYPRYMRCLINYGRVRAKASGWADETNADARGHPPAPAP